MQALFFLLASGARVVSRDRLVKRNLEPFRPQRFLLRETDGRLIPSLFVAPGSFSRHTAFETTIYLRRALQTALN